MSEGESKVNSETPPKPEPAGGQDGFLTASRRQFLTGAGIGLAAGAVGAVGVMTVVRPAERETGAAPGGQAGQTTAIPASMRRVSLNINGTVHDVTVDVRQSLWEVMTYELGMVGANLGCDRAECGACAVVVDGRAMNSCSLMAARLGRGQKILTVEGLAKGTTAADLHPIQRAYWQEGGFQCGLCTRGFVMSTYALLTKIPSPTEDQVREGLAGNICRCSEYPKIYDSVFRAADEMRKKA